MDVFAVRFTHDHRPGFGRKGDSRGQSLTYGMSLGRHWVYLMPATAADLL
jgi:hypothetical protein